MEKYLPYGSLLIGLVTLFFSLVHAKHKAGIEHVRNLEQRLNDLEEQLATSHKRVEELEGENLRLLRRVLTATL